MLIHCKLHRFMEDTLHGTIKLANATQGLAASAATTVPCYDHLQRPNQQ
jgi:hypothetical protein